MKKYLACFTLLFSFSCLAQVPKKVDLSAYAPTRLEQYRGTCYAYATTYTALSMQYNICSNAQSFQEVNDQAFSASFTASVLRSQKCFFRKLFSFWSCNSAGEIIKAAAVLEKTGALRAKQHPECCFVPDQKQLDSAARYRIKPAKTILALDAARDSAVIVSSFKDSLARQIPIICAIHQTRWLLNNQQIDIVLPKEKDPGVGPNTYKDSNHAICIVGYDDERNGGSFLIKNNYASFGLNGFAWIKYQDFLPYLSYAIVLGKFEQPRAI